MTYELSISIMIIIIQNTGNVMNFQIKTYHLDIKLEKVEKGKRNAVNVEVSRKAYLVQSGERWALRMNLIFETKRKYLRSNIGR